MCFLKPVPDPGVVYRHLRRLEEEGMVESRLEQGSGGPARKVYTLTVDGQNYFESWISSLKSRRQSIDQLLSAAKATLTEDSRDKSN